jgi:hypothetical protein
MVDTGSMSFSVDVSFLNLRETQLKGTVWVLVASITIMMIILIDSSLQGLVAMGSSRDL